MQVHTCEEGAASSDSDVRSFSFLVLVRATLVLGFSGDRPAAGRCAVPCVSKTPLTTRLRFSAGAVARTSSDGSVSGSSAAVGCSSPARPLLVTMLRTSRTLPSTRAFGLRYDTFLTASYRYYYCCCRLPLIKSSRCFPRRCLRLHVARRFLACATSQCNPLTGSNETDLKIVFAPVFLLACCPALRQMDQGMKLFVQRDGHRIIFYNCCALDLLEYLIYLSWHRRHREARYERASVATKVVKKSGHQVDN